MMSNTDVIQPHTLACSKLILCILPVADIVIGAMYLHDCPRQHYIPIYLIVVGVFEMMLLALSCLPPASRPTPEEGTPVDRTPNPLSQLCTSWNSLISVFLFCWFIAGNVWIYSIYEPNYIKNATSADPYCDKTLYMFAFWTTTVFYILLGLFLVHGLCFLLCCCLCCQAIGADDEV